MAHMPLGKVTKYNNCKQSGIFSKWGGGLRQVLGKLGPGQLGPGQLSPGAQLSDEEQREQQ